MTPTDKHALRKAIRALKAQYTDEELRKMSSPICRSVLELQAIRDADVILAYASLKDEVCTAQLLDALIDSGKTVLLPKVLDDEHMEARRYTGRGDLAEGAFHILEPVGAPFSALETIDAAIIPGMAFTRDGRRLGRGRSYYDRFLALLPPSVAKIGICFPFQLLADIPTEPHDLTMTQVISL